MFLSTLQLTTLLLKNFHLRLYCYTRLSNRNMHNNHNPDISFNPGAMVVDRGWRWCLREGYWLQILSVCVLWPSRRALASFISPRSGFVFLKHFAVYSVRLLSQMFCSLHSEYCALLSQRLLCAQSGRPRTKRTRTLFLTSVLIVALKLAASCFVCLSLSVCSGELCIKVWQIGLLAASRAQELPLIDVVFVSS